MTPRELRQAVLDHVVPRMLAQGKPSMEGSVCLYRSGTHNEPLCCAVGFLIDDDNYGPAMENNSPKIVGQMGPTSNPTWQAAFREESDFLKELQDCHDNAAVDSRFDGTSFNDEFLKRVQRLAHAYTLSWSY